MSETPYTDKILRLTLIRPYERQSASGRTEQVGGYNTARTASQAGTDSLSAFYGPHKAPPPPPQHHPAHKHLRILELRVEAGNARQKATELEGQLHRLVHERHQRQQAAQKSAKAGSGKAGKNKAQKNQLHSKKAAIHKHAAQHHKKAAATLTDRIHHLRAQIRDLRKHARELDREITALR